jgi:hypothetical protein
MAKIDISLMGVEALSVPLPDVGKEDWQMPGPDFLVVELCRDGAAIEKHTVVDARAYGESRPTAGARAALAAAALPVNAMPLRPGDRLNVRVPIEGEDAPPDDLGEQTYVRSARQRVT